MYKVIFSKASRIEIKNIFKYIALDNEAIANSFVDKMMSYFNDRLSQMPLSCQKVKGEVRILPYKRYGILFLMDEKEMIVKVLHIFSGGQDWEGWV